MTHMTLERLGKRLSRIFSRGENIVVQTVEEAVQAWESNKDGSNPDGFRIVRGTDGKPIEVLNERGGAEPVLAILVNGMRCQHFQVKGDMQSLEQALRNLEIQQNLLHDVFDRSYIPIGIQHLNAQVREDHQGFICGKLC